MTSRDLPKLTIDALRFDVGGWTFHGDREPGRVRVWETGDHDAVSLHFFDRPPDLPAAKTVEALREFYRAQLAQSPAKPIECDVVRLAGTASVRLIIKAPLQPQGNLYQGALTLPFRDFSFVIKAQCREQGVTGMREAVLADKMLQAGRQPNLSGSGPIFENWNPDAPEHDAQFPMHPISRLRRLLERITASATLDRAIATTAPGFDLPPPATR